jgi:hypothetical protein
MNKFLGFLEAVYMWSYFVVVIVLRLFRLISHDKFLSLLFGDDKEQFSKEDVSFKKIYKNLQ